MSEITVGISEMQVSARPDDFLVSYALGSCIAVIAHDPVLKVGGLIHFMLPVSSASPEKAKENPMMFADTGVPLLFHELYDKGCQKKDLVVKVAGGGKLYDDHGTFNIGQRNYTMVRKMFWQRGVVIRAEDVGGSVPRTVRLSIGTGAVQISSQGKEKSL
jgi:chemotaxis protein CheD